MNIFVKYTENIELELDIAILEFREYRPATQYVPAQMPEVEWEINQIKYDNKIVQNVKQQNMNNLRKLVDGIFETSFQRAIENTNF